MLPFTTERFLDVFGAYNQAIWPAQLIAWALGLLAATRTVRPAGPSDRAVCGILAVFWLWMGGVYHMLYFAEINPIARLFGVAFMVQGALFAWQAATPGGIDFRFRLDLPGAVGLAFMAYGLVVYPLLGPPFGHVWPRMPTFGVTPCPTTIFTFGVLLTARGGVPWRLLAIPFLWSLVGGSASVILAVPEDYALILAGVLGIWLVAWRNLRSAN